MIYKPENSKIPAHMEKGKGSVYPLPLSAFIIALFVYQNQV